MYGLPSALSVTPATRSARRVLTSLMETVGSTGLAAASTSPALLAAVDQHAAAVRDALPVGRRTITLAALAGYAEGVREAAAEHGWQPPVHPIDWQRSDWVLTRLLAVCALARQAS